ncbi:YfjI family protein [Acetobacterium sp.]|uniref:YfjI family protein n=1 Tax=Acetobacterium sp. TaxID=1872094 RepID=UPI0027183F7E|nr:YfjI family protein [Acetobacterium sp.]MDO9491110.1 YfjI family protein [Acetobacterium sp.]
MNSEKLRLLEALQEEEKKKHEDEIIKKIEALKAEEPHKTSNNSDIMGNVVVLNECDNTTIIPESTPGIKWEKPKPLEKEVKLPSFPLGSLPPVVKNYVQAVSESTATPIDMCAVASLAVIAGTVQGKFKIRGKPDYFEPLNIYTLIIANPGERKSAIINAMTKHVHEFEREVNKSRQAEIDRQKIELSTKEKQIKKLEDANKADEAYYLKTECRELEAEQIRPLRLIADDVTPEALTSLLADNDGKLSVISAEGGFFDTLAGKYSNTVSIDTTLKAHCGDSIRVDRRGRPPEYIPAPTLTILLAVQSNVIEGMFDNGTFKGRGLTARFLYCKPNSMVGHRSFDTTPISPVYERAYRDLIYSLLEIKNDQPKIIKLSEEATAAYRLFYEDIENRQQVGNDLSTMTDFASKLHGAVLRIAGILHCMGYESLLNGDPVSMETMANAMDIGGYFLIHSMNAYDLMGADDQMKQVRFVLRKLEQNPQEQYKKNEILIMCRNPVIKVTADLEPLLDTLIEYGYLFEIKPLDTGRLGRKSATIYKLNPLYFIFNKLL